MSQSSLSPSSTAEIMLFGVRVRVDPMRKSVSMNNLSEYEPVVNNGNEMPKDAAPAEGSAGYASADEAVPQPSGVNRERKRGQISYHHGVLVESEIACDSDVRIIENPLSDPSIVLINRIVD